MEEFTSTLGPTLENGKVTISIINAVKQLLFADTLVKLPKHLYQYSIGTNKEIAKEILKAFESRSKKFENLEKLIEEYGSSLKFWKLKDNATIVLY